MTVFKEVSISRYLHAVVAVAVVGGDGGRYLDVTVETIAAAIFLQQRLVVHVTCAVALSTAESARHR